MRKFYIFALIGSVLIITGSAFAEQITLTTYYPAPFGVYRELTLYPHDAPTACTTSAHEGKLYYDKSEDKVYVCKGTALWKEIGGAGLWAALGNNIYYNTGNVGIGTASPSYKLQANGDIYANGGWFRVSGTGVFFFQSYGGGWYMQDSTWIRSWGSKSIYHNTGIMRTDGTFQVGSGGNRFIVNTAGNVGIGTTSPNYKLDVVGSIQGTGGLYNLAGKQVVELGNVTDWLRIGQGSFSNGIAAYRGISTDGGFYAGLWQNAGAGNVKGTGIAYFSGAGNNYFAGRVGIGTASPEQKLDIRPASNQFGLQVKSTNYNSYFESTNTGFGGTASIFHIKAASAVTGPYALRVETGGDSNVFGVMCNGRVGIGTANPSEKLEVNGSVAVSNYLEIGTAGLRNNSYLLFDAWATATGAWIRWDGSDDGDTGPLGTSQFEIGSDVYVYGGIKKSGTCSFVEDYPNDPSKQIVYVTLEGPEAGTYIRGQGQLFRGEAEIQLPEHFSLVTENSSGLSAQITPIDECQGLRVASISSSSIEVKELNNGQSNTKFYYLVNGIRKGYQNFSPIQDKK